MSVLCQNHGQLFLVTCNQRCWSGSGGGRRRRRCAWRLCCTLNTSATAVAGLTFQILQLLVQALLEAERRGETTATLRLEAAPHFHESDGSVAVPRKWENILSKSEVFQKPRPADGAARTPPRTPPP